MTKEYYIKIKNEAGVWFYWHKSGHYVNCAWNFDPLLETKEEALARAKKSFAEENFAYGIGVHCINDSWHK